MMMKKKEEMQKRRRKRKDYDLINDSDELIADMINKMKVAAEVDRAKVLKYLFGKFKKCFILLFFLMLGIANVLE